jgi:hypothetical protein
MTDFRAETQLEFGVLEAKSSPLKASVRFWKQDLAVGSTCKDGLHVLVRNICVEYDELAEIRRPYQ